jgi:hypothetical protein
MPVLGVLPKDYGIFETRVLEDLMRLFNSTQIKQATGDVCGRIYEYFLAKFSIQKAHDNGEFFTPSSLVQTIVNVIQPDHGTVFDPACGSGGMFVQSSHFIEHEGGDTARRVVFYGQEKNRDTIHIAKMNLAVRSNFFYTRSVPCELWFFDRAKPAERQDQVLMLDARQVYRKVTRKIYDFSPEQMKNLSAIVWLYCGQQHRFLALVRDYLGAVCTESIAIPAKLIAFEQTLADLRSRFSGLVKGMDKDGTLGADKTKALMEAAAELADAEQPYMADHTRLLAELDSFRTQYTVATTLPLGEEPGLWETNQGLHAARRKFDSIAEALRGLMKQVDLLYKLAPV